MTDYEIFCALRAGGMTVSGALGTMANMRAESVMRPNNAQDSYHIDDETYTAQINAGLRDFLDDVGYGYCQWTTASRKAKLLAYARSLGASIDDPGMQLAFILKEMREDFPNVWRVVTTFDDLFECTKIVLEVYENPQVKNLSVRYQYAQEFAAQLANAPAEQAAVPVSVQPGMDYIVAQLQLCMAHDGYWSPEQIDGIKTLEFRERIVEYAADVAGC